MTELTGWLDQQNINYNLVDNEVVDIPGLGKVFLADLSGVKSIFRIIGEEMSFNLMEDPATLLDEGIFYVAFIFGNNYYYYDIREEFRLNILKYVGQPKAATTPFTYVNLGIHTPFELLNGSGDISLWVKKAKWIGHSAIGICDRNTMAATLTLQKECAKAGIKHIFGYSFTLDFFGEDVAGKIYCQSQYGLQNLMQIQKEIMVDSDSGKIDLTGLLNHAPGNVLVLGTLSSYWMQRNERILADMSRRFRKVYYQVDLTEYKADRIDSEYLYAIQHFFDNFFDPVKGEFAIEPVLICDCHYPDADDARSKIILNKISSGAAHMQSDDQYFKTADELYQRMLTVFDSDKLDIDTLMEKMCRNTLDITRGAEAAYELGKMYMPRYDMRPNEKLKYGNRRNMFHCLLNEGMEEKVPPADHQQYSERLKEEIYIIESTNNVDYFLIQWDMIQEARRRGIVTGIGRGSAGGSLVSYLLGIISIDPIKYDLLFSRFLVPERCGLFWKDAVTVLADELPVKPSGKYVEITSEGKRYCFDKDAQFRILREGAEMTVYADQLRPDDEVIIDQRDLIWNLKEVR